MPCRFRASGRLTAAAVLLLVTAGGVPGALAGLAYLAPACTASSAILPEAFPAALRDFVTAPARQAGVVPPAAASDPLVETQYLTGDSGALVILINWNAKPVEKLIVRFPGARGIARVRSLRTAGFFRGHLDEADRGALSVERIEGIPQVQLRLEVTDILFVD